MKRKKILYIAAVAALSYGLMGCSKDKKVEYVDDEVISTDSDASNIVAGTKLKDRLGVTETSWKEKVETADGTADLKATISVPDVENMYTMLASEKYLTNEDKKRIMEQIVDADSIKQCRDMISTKEDIELILEGFKESEEDSDYDKIDKQYWEERYEKAISNSDFTEDVGDYSGCAYEGTKGGETYYFSFFSDEERNRSAFVIGRDMDHCISYGLYDGEDNICGFTEEEAKKRAIEFCEDMGLPKMQVVNCSALMCFDEDYSFDYSNPDRENNEWYDGYQIDLARDIEGVTALSQCIVNFEDIEGAELSYTDLEYSREYVRISFDSKGLVNMRCTGLLTEGELSNPVPLLGIEQIKDIVRQNISATTAGWHKLELRYLRIKDKEKEDSYCFLPIWRFGADFSGFGMEGEADVHGEWAIYINAIDGSVIDIVKDGAITNKTSDVFTEYE